jgi:ELWxxDGT repeat protein
VWKSAGSAATTDLVRDIVTGAGNSGVQNIVAVGSAFAFLDPFVAASGTEPWATQGTSATTGLIQEIVAGTSGSLPARFTAISSTAALFVANTNASGERRLWSTSGTSATTSVLKDIRALDAADPDVREITPAVGHGFFTADDGVSGRELWATDYVPAGAGTHVLDTIRPGLDSANPADLAALGGVALFRACSNTVGCELFASDGTVVDVLADIVPGRSSSYPSDLVAIGDHVYFWACTPAAGCEPWVTDGVDVAPLGEVRAGTNNGRTADVSDTAFVALDGLVFFTADDGTGTEVWAAPEVLFLDGFESGDTADWSAVSP